MKKIIKKIAAIAVLVSSVFFLSGCIHATANNSLDYEENADKQKLDATIKTEKGKNFTRIYIEPKKDKVFSYTLFEVYAGTVTQIDKICSESAYTINSDGSLTLNTIPHATFVLNRADCGTFYVAAEVNDHSYKDGDDISIYTKILFTELIPIY